MSTSESIKAKGMQSLSGLAIIVLGVTIGLAGDSWREAMIERRDSREYVLRLKAEVQETLIALEAAKLRYQRVTLATAELTSLLPGLAPESEGRAVALYHVAVAVAAGRSSLGPDATFRDLVASGRLGAITETSLRTSIVAFYTSIDQIGGPRMDALIELPLRERYLSLTGCIPAYCPALSDEDRNSAVNGVDIGRDFMESLLPPQREQRLLRAMRDEREFGDDLRRYLAAVQSFTVSLENAHGRGEALLLQLE
jgi:hypothetical protein